MKTCQLLSSISVVGRMLTTRLQAALLTFVTFSSVKCKSTLVCVRERAHQTRIQSGGPGQEHGHPWQLVQNCFFEVDHWWAKGIPGHILCYCFHHSSKKSWFFPPPIRSGMRGARIRGPFITTTNPVPLFLFWGSGAESGPKSMRENAYPTKSNMLNTNLRPIQVESDF